MANFTGLNVLSRKRILESVCAAFCYISPLSSTTFPLPSVSVPRLLFISPALPLFFHCSLRGKAAEEDSHETNPKQLQTKGWRKQVREAWTRSTVGLYKGKKLSHCYSPSKGNTAKEVERCLLAGRVAMLVLLVRQNLPKCWRSPKARAGSLAWLFPVPKTEYCGGQQRLGANYKRKVNVQLHQNPHH